jgi:hypothetical protein
MNIKKNTHSLNNNSKAKDTKEKYIQRVFNILHKQPMSRRMAITKAGYPDQTYMITQSVYDWIKQGKACVIGQIRCTRSGKLVECITTNPNLFIHSKTGSDE